MAAVPVAAADEVRERYQQLHSRWESQAEQLAARCEAAGQSDAAEAIRRLIQPPEKSDVISIPILPHAGPEPTTNPNASRSDSPQALARLRKQYARELFELAEAAFHTGDVSACYELLREIIEHDPDQGAVRALLGQTRYRDQWVSQYAAAKLRAGHVWDPLFGWVPRAHLSKLQSGERLWKGQWLPADEVDKYRQDWANAWEIETEHYQVRTNTSLERGVAFADKLQKLHAAFFRLFAGFFTPRDQIAVLFDAPSRRTALGKIDKPRRPERRFRVNFYRTREQYLDALRPHVKTGLDISTGMYLTNTRTAYFFVHDQMDESTVIHEATHQLFSETREHTQGIGSRGNHWVIEGIACYMESFRDCGDHVELGSWDTPRLKVGRQRIIEQNQYLPLDKLVQLEMQHFDNPAVYVLYSQSACLCRFFMQHERGRYRDGFVKYLEQVYSGKADHETLAELLGTDYAQLDRQFRQHVEAD
jgi:hypothetical protein